MKILLVKDWRDVDVWGAVPTRWHKDSNPHDILASYTARPQCWGLLRKLQADLIILNVEESWYKNKAVANKWNEESEYRLRHWNSEIFAPMDDSLWYKKHLLVQPEKYAVRVDNYPTQHNVDFSRYDVVLCSNPFLCREVIDKNKNTIFAYWNHERFWEYYQSQYTGVPYDMQYDLHLDHLEGPSEIHKLPQTIYFPYITHTIIREDFDDIQKVNIAVDRRTLLENKEMAHKCDKLSVGNCVTISARNNKLNGLQFHERLASAKYFVYVRNHFSGSGQAVLEAAAQGAIIMGYHWGRPAQTIMHPECLITSSYIQASRDRPPFGIAGCSMAAVEKILNKIEKNKSLQREIIQHQDTMLDGMFDNALVRLTRAVEIKRGMRS